MSRHDDTKVSTPPKKKGDSELETTENGTEYSIHHLCREQWKLDHIALPPVPPGIPLGPGGPFDMTQWHRPEIVDVLIVLLYHTLHHLYRLERERAEGMSLHAERWTPPLLCQSFRPSLVSLHKNIKTYPQKLGLVFMCLTTFDDFSIMVQRATDPFVERRVVRDPHHGLYATESRMYHGHHNTPVSPPKFLSQMRALLTLYTMRERGKCYDARTYRYPAMCIPDPRHHAHFTSAAPARVHGCTETTQSESGVNGRKVETDGEKDRIPLISTRVGSS